MDSFKGQAEKFHLTFASDSGSSERVLCEIGLEGVVLKTTDGQRTLKKYPLNHISRWALRGTSLVLYTKTPVDVEERTVTLQAGDSIIRSVLDTLTCSCMQMCELLQSGEQSGERAQAANSLSALLSGGSRKRAELPSQDEVEFWHKAEKSGWLQSQGEHLRTWRRRWFVLKQGFLFRFADQNVVASTKPRGIVDLSKVTDVVSGREATGKNNSITLSTANGSVHYVADSETEQVEWFSALEGAVAKIVRAVAGLEEEDSTPAVETRSNSSGRDWANQLEKGFASVSKGSSSRPDGNTMVNIVGYSGATALPAARRQESYAADNGNYGGTISYGQIDGIAGVVRDEPRSNTSSVQVSYPAYPTLQPITSEPPASSYNQYTSPPQQDYNSYDQASFYQQPQMHQQSQPQAQTQPHQHQQQQSQPYPENQGSQLQYGARPYGQQPTVSYEAAAPVANDAGIWQTHYTAAGTPYYFNPSTNVTQWDAPANMM
ncbi:hypothetical protein WJX77_002547 [Trebouxia sp. C0004]